VGSGHRFCKRERLWEGIDHEIEYETCPLGVAYQTPRLLCTIIMRMLLKAMGKGWGSVKVDETLCRIRF
jgi:hypothetical protein